MNPERRPARKLPLVLSVLILAATGIFYLFFYEHQLAYVRARDARLLAVPERSLTGMARSGGNDVLRRFSRSGNQLTVSVTRTGTGPEAARKPEAPATFTLSLKDVLSQVPLGSEAFDLLLVADDQGAVIDQLGDGTLSRNSLGGLAPADAKPDAKGIDVASLWNASQMQRVGLDGRDYTLFCHPVPLPHELPELVPKGTRDGFIFCGFVSADRLSRQALRISPLMVFGLVALLAFALLTPPFIKLWLLRPAERLRFTDAYALMLCTFTGLLMLSVAVLATSLFATLRRSADAALEHLALQVRHNLEDELSRARAQLAALDHAVYAPEAGQHLAIRGPRAIETDAGARLGGPLLDYPFFETVAWSKADGEQMFKWSPLGNTKPAHRFRVATREYFKAVRDGRLWPGGCGSQPPSSGCFVEAVQTWSTGQTRAVLALRSEGRDSALVAAMTTTLLALSDPVLPPRMGFAVIDAQGQVLFHSDRRQSLTHNFFAESGEDPDLRSAAAAGADDLTGGHYFGQRHRFYTTRLSAIPWTVVAFRKEDLLRAANVEVAEDAAGMALVYALLSYALPSLLGVYIARRRTSWFWPSAERSCAYADLCLWLGLLAAAFAAGLRDTQPDEAVALAFALPWAVLAGGALAFWASPLARLVRAAPVRWRAGLERALCARFRALHLCASLLFLAAYTSLPALALVKAAGDVELQTLARLEQRTRVERTGQRARMLETLLRDRMALSGGSARAQLARAEAERIGTYDAGLFDLPHVPDSDEKTMAAFGAVLDGPAPRGFLRLWLEKAHAHKPLLDPVAMELRHLQLAEAVHGAWRAGQDGQLEFALAGSGPEQPARDVVGPWPSFWSLLGLGPVLAGLALLVAAAGWIRWCFQRLFLVDAARPVPPPIRTLKEGGVAGHTLGLVPSGHEIDVLLEGGWCQHVSFRIVEPLPAAVDASRPLVVDSREFASAETTRRLAILEYIEARVAHGDQQVVVLACSHPLESLCAQQPGSDAAPAWAAGEVERWLRLLDHLVPVTLRDGATTRVDPDDDAEEHSARRALGPAATPALVTLLAHELAPAPHLRWLVDHHVTAGGFAGVRYAEVLERLAEVARGYYWALWSACSQDEKLSLVQLCEEGFLNPKRSASAKRLMDRGLVVRDPALRPMNASFGVFVRATRSSEPIDTWEQSGSGFGWSDVQLPLVTVAGVCGFVLVLSRQDLLDTTVPLLSALGATGVPLLAKLAGTFKSLAEGRGASAAQRA